MTDTATEIGAVNKRLERLEHQNRRLRLALVAAGVIVGAVLLTGALPPKPRTVTASRFVLVDSGGKGRAALSLVNGEPSFALFDAAGRGRVNLELSKSGKAAFTLFDAAGKTRLALALLESGEPRFDLYDARGKLGAALALVNGGAAILLSDAGDKAKASLVLANGAPEFTLFDASGKPRADFRLPKDGEPSLNLIDSSGSPRLVLGQAELASKTQGGSTITPLSSITAFDKEGNLLKRWP